MLDGDCTTLPLDGTSLLLNVAKFKFIVVTPGHEKKEQLSAFRVESESVMQTWVNVICAVQANCDTRSGELPSPVGHLLVSLFERSSVDDCGLPIAVDSHLK